MKTEEKRKLRPSGVMAEWRDDLVSFKKARGTTGAVDAVVEWYRGSVACWHCDAVDFTTKVLCQLLLERSKETPHLQMDITRSFSNRFLKVGGVLKRKRQALSVKVGPEGLALFV